MLTKTLRICRLPSNRKYTPGINLKGEYLKQFGFSVGDAVCVEISNNKILITKKESETSE